MLIYTSASQYLPHYSFIKVKSILSSIAGQLCIVIEVHGFLSCQCFVLPFVSRLENWRGSTHSLPILFVSVQIPQLMLRPLLNTRLFNEGIFWAWDIIIISDMKCSYPVFFFFCSNEPDLRDDKQFFIDHPGAVPITTAQVSSDFWITFSNELQNSNLSLFLVLTFPFFFKGEELRKLIGSPAYIECSSKTQQVYTIKVVTEQSCEFLKIFLNFSYLLCRMWRQYSMQPLGLFFNRQSRRKRKAKHKRPAPYCDLEIGVKWQEPPSRSLLELLWSPIVAWLPTLFLTPFFWFFLCILIDWNIPG